MGTGVEGPSGQSETTGTGETETQEFISKKQIVEMWLQEVGIVPPNIIVLFEKSDQTIGTESNRIKYNLNMMSLILYAFLLSASEDREIYFEFWDTIFTVSSKINYEDGIFSTQGNFTLHGHKDTYRKEDYMYTTMKNSVASLLNLVIN